MVSEKASMFSEDEEDDVRAAGARREPAGSARQPAGGPRQTPGVGFIRDPADMSVEELLRDYDALLRRRRAGPAHLKMRLRQMGISERKIKACHTREELVELILFEEIPGPPRARPGPDAFWPALLLLAWATLIVGYK